MNDKLQILQLVRLRGRTTPADIADSAGLAVETVDAVVRELGDTGLITDMRGRLKLTGDGRAELTAMIAAERQDVDQAQMSEAYHDFSSVNTTFKQLVTDWQLVGEDRPNDHSDAEYDAAVISRLGDIHSDFRPLLERLTKLAPRLQMYPARFDAALVKIRGGDHSWLARPLIDSYHTAWFELHEDLMGLAGLTRADEAAAGRAQ
jgi:hypothetical protein